MLIDRHQRRALRKLNVILIFFGILCLVLLLVVIAMLNGQTGYHGSFTLEPGERHLLTNGEDSLYLVFDENGGEAYFTHPATDWKSGVYILRDEGDIVYIAYHLKYRLSDGRLTVQVPAGLLY